MNKLNPAVDAYINRSKKWRSEMSKLRSIALDSGLTEALKWGVPCYTLGKANVVLIHEFKEYCALLFFKGALLKDSRGILVQQTENTQAARQARFTNVQEIGKLEPVMKKYINEAIEVEKAGLKVDFKKTTEYKMTDEFKKKLDEDPALKAAFHSLTPGRQREYLLYFASAKQAATREARVEKYAPRILKGKGLND
jgi:uncharacterized protein YdeI (YjbR/CyaY-like superfamily)